MENSWSFRNIKFEKFWILRCWKFRNHYYYSLFDKILTMTVLCWLSDLWLTKFKFFFADFNFSNIQSASINFLKHNSFHIVRFRVCFLRLYFQFIIVFIRDHEEAKEQLFCWHDCNHFASENVIGNNESLRAYFETAFSNKIL